MKLFRIIIMTLFAMLTCIPASAKHVKVPQMYMFGFSASFQDTIVYFTDIQEVSEAWIESKNDFLLGRDIYSSQLRNYMKEANSMTGRTCMVMYDTKRSKLEKKYLKLHKLYTQFKDKKQHFDVRYLTVGDFQFKTAELQFDDLEGNKNFAVLPHQSDDKSVLTDRAKRKIEKEARKAALKKMDKDREDALKRIKAGEEMMEKKGGKK